MMLTGNIDPEDVKQAISSGVSEYLLKPFKISTLRNKVCRAFSSPIPKNSISEVLTTAEPNETRNALRSILIVDDEPNNITVLTELLKEKYNLQACLSGAKALSICDSEKLPDLILLDIMMPKMDGLTVCNKLKSNPLTEHIPIIFITALSQTKDVVKGLSMGAADYISKPISPEITLARIETHIKIVNQRKEVELQLDTMMENMRLKDDIERITHHDLKNPLSVIVAAADTLKNEGEYSKQGIELIADSADLMKQMIDEKMLLLQLENKTTDYALLPINALALINKVVYGQRIKCKQKCILVKYKFSNKINFLGVELFCFNLFNNLLTNAIEAAPDNTEVEIALELNSDKIVTTIKNQGLIPEKIQARFFDKFITHGKEGGTGLGTYSAKLLALAQDGDISFLSNEEDGTSLIVKLKAAP